MIKFNRKHNGASDVSPRHVPCTHGRVEDADSAKENCNKKRTKKNLNKVQCMLFCCCWCCRCCRKESITRRNRAGGENYHKCRRGRSLIIRPNNSHTRPLHARIYEYIYMYICIKIFRGDDGQKHDTFQNQNIFSSAEKNREKKGDDLLGKFNTRVAGPKKKDSNHGTSETHDQ
jgi:hypothetical protein